eukprot:scaffold311687_cov19-Prasinocladus_malaysianus.AAC.1
MVLNAHVNTCHSLATTQSAACFPRSLQITLLCKSIDRYELWRRTVPQRAYSSCGLPPLNEDDGQWDMQAAWP